MTVIDLVLRKKGRYSGNTQYYDKLLEAGAIAVDQDGYTAGLDRVYDVKGLKNMHAEIENNGPNGLTYKIEKARREFALITDLTTPDFDEDIKADTNVAAGSKATGTVDVTGGPSVKADGTLTLVSAVANAFATGTVTCASVLAGDTVTVNGLVYTAVNGAKADDTEFDMSGTDDQCATDLADSIDDDVRSGTSGDLSATATTDTVTAVTDVLGTGGNAITLVSSNGTRLAVSGATFSGGVNADTATVNGLVYKAVAGVKANDTEFSIDTSDNAAATDLADSIDDDVRPPITVPGIDVTAVAATNVVTVSAPVNDGAGGNAIDLTGTANITADNATLTGGVSSTCDGITIDGIEIMSGAVPFRTSSDLTADDIAANITAFTSAPNYTATATTGLITITAVNEGPSTAVVVSATTVLTTTDVNMSGGGTGRSINDIIDISPESTAIRIRVKRQVVGDDATLKGVVSVN